VKYKNLHICELLSFQYLSVLKAHKLLLL